MKGQPLDISQAKLLKEIDEFGSLDADVLAFKPKKDRHEQLRKKFQSLHDNSAADQAFTEESDNYTVVIGERAMSRCVTHMRSLIRYLGTAASKVLRINLEDFDKYVREPDRARFIEEGQTGARKVKVIPKSSPLAKVA